MRKHITFACAALLLLVVAAQPALPLAQKQVSSLPDAADKVEKKIREELPEWDQNEIQAGALPAPGSSVQPPGEDRLIIRQWRKVRQRENGNHADDGAQSVRITLALYDSTGQAAEAVRHFAMVQGGERVNGLGDEAYSYGLTGDIVFRRDSVVVYVSAGVNKNINPATGIHNYADAAKAGDAAAAPLARGFAHRVDATLR